MQYQAPLNVDLAPEVRAKTYRQRRVSAATSHAKWAAKKYATMLIRRQENNFALDAIENVGGEAGIAKTMATYAVHEPLRLFAARHCVRLVREKVVRQ